MKKRLDSEQDYGLYVLLLRTARVFGKVRARELSEHGLSSAQVGVLVIAYTTGGNATPAEIMRQMHREPHTISALLRRMEEKGLVRRVKDLSRKNQIRIELTQNGMEAYCQSTNREAIQKMFSALSEEERKSLKSALEKLKGSALKILGADRKLFYS
ncbi:MarR family winged helix-turn-helix transcriptional regulator [Chloroflexota bacterium]